MIIELGITAQAYKADDKFWESFRLQGFSQITGHYRVMAIEILHIQLDAAIDLYRSRHIAFVKIYGVGFRIISNYTHKFIDIGAAFNF